ncbi:MAG TPA: sialidase, partial [Candidatus Marinimicrobia bacterium]|nr:sialidase [Candidatus Neomarinimicrobiota bacterium]
PLTYYAGAASGGIWKTIDGGLNWQPIFDGKPVHAIGALAVASSDPNVVWAGTGEPFIRSNVSIGDGVWKSTDAGKNWTHMGLDKTGRISRMVIHPTNPDVVYAASLGHAYLPQKERGIYRTKDGGETWDLVLAVNDSTGASDLVMDPNNPRILFAGMWQLDIKTWGRESGGPGSGLFMTRNGGDTWERLKGSELPKLPVGKVAVCNTPANSNRIYALIETGDGVPWHGRETESGELWRTDNGGNTWKLVNHNRDLAGRTAYYSRCAVSPDDPDEVYFLAAAYSTTKDGGLTSEVITDAGRPNWDHHDMWIDPTNADRMAVAGDGGVAISNNRGKTWFRIQLPVAQLYHVTVDNNVPYYVYANRQDGPSTRGPSRSRTGGFFGGGISRGMWHSVGGGESGFATPDPIDPDIIWSSASGAGARGGIVVRYNEKNRQYRQLEVWPESTGGWPAKGLKYRFQWTFPLHISSHDNNTVYVTSQHVHKTRNGGQSWDVISPDLSTNDESKQGISGGLTPDNIGVEYCCVIYAFDESPVEKGVLWAGTNDGLVHVSRDDGKTWKDVTGNIPALPPLGTVRNIDASKWDAGKAYITVDFHQVGNFEPYIYKTENYGRRWKKITRGIPSSTLSYTRNVREDPIRPGLLYLGTENTLYVSLNDGDNWQPLMNNMPASPMYWIVIQEEFNDLVVGTYGRGIWILDDITPLQQLTDEVTSSDAYLFEPRKAYRFRSMTSPFTMFDDPSAGENPPYGASINYWLKQASDDSATIKISDSSGNLIKKMKGPSVAGINRVWWNLQGEPTTKIVMRTKPLYADWVQLDEEGTRDAVVGRISTLAPPGTYIVELETGDQKSSQRLAVVKDPHSEGSISDIVEQTEMVQDIQADMNSVASFINRIEIIRSQIYNLRTMTEDHDAADEIASAVESLNEKLIDVESELYQMKLTGTGQDRVRWPTKLAGRLNYLAGNVAVADFPPNDQQRKVHQILKERLTSYERQFDEILRDDIPTFDRLLRKHNLTGVITGK